LECRYAVAVIEAIKEMSSPFSEGGPMSGLGQERLFSVSVNLVRFAANNVH
jgi:hypothetical protein